MPAKLKALTTALHRGRTRTKWDEATAVALGTTVPVRAGRAEASIGATSSRPANTSDFNEEGEV